MPPVADIKPKESIKSPPSTSHVAPAPVPPLEAKKYQSKGPAPVVTAPRVKGEKYTLKAMLDLRTSASLLEGTQVCMQDLKRLLEETPELDPEKDMPSRQQGDAGGRGAPRTGTGPGAIGAGTPRKGGRLGKNDVPLRDKNGKIIEVKALELSEGRWKPGRATDDEEKVYKAAKGIMNKLTLEKFDKLYGELLNVGITNASLLRGFVVLIYDKAVLEPTFINMYARMCQRLAQDLPEFSDEEGVLPFGDVLVGK